jgi:hypothetical protein
MNNRQLKEVAEKSIKEIEDTTKILELFTKEGKIYCKVINEFYSNPLNTASLCYVIYATTVSSIPKDGQEEFKKSFLSLLEELINNGKNYTGNVNNENS